MQVWAKAWTTLAMSSQKTQGPVKMNERGKIKELQQIDYQNILLEHVNR